MNYRHSYHAGNFTEVVKHGVLTIILDYLRKKPAPFCYIDTHAGEGLYDLTSLEAEKTGEAAAGIQRLIGGEHPDFLQIYLQALKAYQTGDKLTSYPGSPLLAYHLLRPQDSMILNEFHPETNSRLRQNFDKKSVAIHQRDAYELLPAILPPPAGRGVVLIDPPFEQKDENEKIQLMLAKALKRWAHGIYVIWYPVTALRRWDLKAVIHHNQIKNYLIADLTIAEVNPSNQGLLGCQLLIVNPPWQLAETLRPLMKYLWQFFAIDGQGKWSVNSSPPYL